MAEPPKIGVVTVTYNSATVLEGFMKSTLAQTHSNFVLYVVDNASKDDTLSLLTKYDDLRIRTIVSADNVGVAAGNNIGIRAALNDGCDYVLLLNNDTEFPADMFERLLYGIGEYQSDIIVPKKMYFDEPNRIWCAGGYFVRIDARLDVYLSKHYGIGEIDKGQYDVPRSIEYSPTCCMLIKRAVFDKIGLMDERYFVYCDDTDFCYRAILAGVRMWYMPSAVLLHKVSSLTQGDTSPFSIRYMTRNRVYFILKHAPRIAQLFCLAIVSAKIWIRYWRKRDSREIFALRRSAFAEGLELAKALRAS